MNVDEIRELFLRGIFRRFGIKKLLDRNAALSERLQKALMAQGVAVRPFAQPHRSTIVSVPVANTDATLAALRTANVVASTRTGRVRLSVHFYNREEEIDRVAELMGNGR